MNWVVALLEPRESIHFLSDLTVATVTRREVGQRITEFTLVVDPERWSLFAGPFVPVFATVVEASREMGTSRANFSGRLRFSLIGAELDPGIGRELWRS